MPIANQFGAWRRGNTLGEGGQAHVFEAENTQTGQVGALKVLKDRNRASRFAREIEAQSRVDHPLVAKILEAAPTAERPYLVMELCREGSLDKRWAEITNDMVRLEIFQRVSAAAAAAHAQGVIHRDIKPSNILFRKFPNEPVLADFGLAFLLADPDTRKIDAERLTSTTRVVGSVFYLAPELEFGQIGVDALSPPIDIYSLGKLLYYLFAGRHLPREHHRKDGLSILEGHHGEALRHLIQEVLDQTILEDPSIRTKGADLLSQTVGRIHDRVSRGGRYVSYSVRQRCIYCQEGFYSLASQSVDARAPHHTSPAPILSGISWSKWCLFRCDRCGNTQVFLQDGLAPDSNLWRL